MNRIAILALGLLATSTLDASAQPPEGEPGPGRTR